MKWVLRNGALHLSTEEAIAEGAQVFSSYGLHDDAQLLGRPGMGQDAEAGGMWR